MGDGVILSSIGGLKFLPTSGGYPSGGFKIFHSIFFFFWKGEAMDKVC